MADRRTGKRVKKERKQITTVLSLDNLFKTFYEAKIAEGVAERTLETYRECYGFFCDYLELKNIPFEADFITPEVLRSYQTYLLKEKVRFDGHKFKSDEEKTVGLSPVTVNTRTKPLRTMFRFLKKEGLIENNPWENVKKVEEAETEIQVMSIDQLNRLLNAPNQRSYAGFRDYTLMTLLIDGFLRINEALSLTVDDIDFTLGMVTVRAEIAKTRTSRVVPLQRKTLNLLKELIDENEDFGSEYVFLTNYGEQLTDDHFRHRLKEYANQAGMKIRVYPHLFRHTSATLFLENGGEVRHLAKILGHADLRMVMRYTHLSKQSLKNQHEQYSPLNYLEGKLNRRRKVAR